MRLSVELALRRIARPEAVYSESYELLRLARLEPHDDFATARNHRGYDPGFLGC